MILIPHMDDGVLACGGTMARLPEKSNTHFIYATDGAQSPKSPFPWRRRDSVDLSAIRAQEAREALRVLGMPLENIRFLGFPDKKLKSAFPELTRSITDHVKRIRPDHILTPFRYDRHPDHITLNRATYMSLNQLDSRIQAHEYFVYYRWRLLPKGDVRSYIRPEYLTKVDIHSYAELKRRALQCHKSQTTKFFPWQERPILTQKLVDDVCNGPEIFLRDNLVRPGVSIFAQSQNWIRFVHAVEPTLKKCKDTISTLLDRSIFQNGKRPN
ncbi:MAG: PIG-L deacetylase family protein [Planctomycetota bacterium]|jgi:LmbE family N-acetylglucosaminyl deacetylase